MASEAVGWHAERRRPTWRLAVAWLVYDTVVRVAVWAVLVPVTIVQMLRGRAARRDLAERLGGLTIPAPKSTRVVVHAVSAGEAASAGAFIRALADARPQWSVVVTCGNRDAHAMVRCFEGIASVEAVINLPWDQHRVIKHWLRRLRASAFVVVEPEIWPNLYRACDNLRVPLFLVNGRLWPRDVGRYRLARGFFADVLRVPVWIGVQSATERARFIAIGAPRDRIEIVDSLKFDASARAAEAAPRPPSPTIVAGSTYRAEEDCLISAIESLRPMFPQVRLVLAPRHVNRAGSVAARMTARGHRTLTGTTGDGSGWDVLVIDRLGELRTLYALADIAFVGGTLVPRGGHNVLEPASMARVTVVGPYVDHIRSLVDGLEAVGGIVTVPDAAALTVALGRLLEDETLRRDVGERAAAYCSGHRGGARHSVEAMTSRMEALRGGAVFSARDRTRARQATWPLDASEAGS